MAGKQRLEKKNLVHRNTDSAMNSLFGTTAGTEQIYMHPQPQPRGFGMNFLDLINAIQGGQNYRTDAMIGAMQQPTPKMVRRDMSGNPIDQTPVKQRSPGLAGWYEMNPGYRRGETYAAGRKAQQQGNFAFRKQQELEQRGNMAAALGNFAKMYDEARGQIDESGLPLQGNLNKFVPQQR